MDAFLKKDLEIFITLHNLNAELLCTIYKTTLLPSVRNFFGRDNHRQFLQEDNDPKYTSEKIESQRDKYQVKRIS